MGRLTRLLAATIAAMALALLAASTVAAFDGFGARDADSSYGREMRFDVGYSGGPPDRLELLLRTPGTDGAFVAPVDGGPTRATYVWDTAADYVTPNTIVTYQWRAIDEDGTETLTDEGTLRYEDDRPGLDWQTAQLGETTVHWYGDAEARARRFGELTAVGVERAEDLLGTELAGPVDVFVYDDRDDFFGALGPGAREWTGAAAFSEIRTIFMWLGGGSEAYLERAMVHEVTHIVFSDATDNPFHEPARWFNEGTAVWSETRDAGGERSTVEAEADGAGLFAFDAITEQFPIGDRGAGLSYAQGTTMVDMIIDEYGEEAMSRIAAAYRDGASDEEALEAGTGVPADQLYDDFYAAFGVDAPTPIAADPIGASDVDRPSVGEVDHGGVGQGDEEPPDEASPGEPQTDGGGGALIVIGLAALVAVAVGAAAIVSRRTSRSARG
ncbi:MAG TPA: peptidase MA family metallohydrolase [Candidatus Limnocylindria bacterium]|nr:peptidase MA family metallohydrolase [Candidatus Limnocylindria bacterium]